MRQFIVFFLTLFLVSFSLQAQSRFSYSLEAVAGVGFDRGPLFSVTPQFVAQYNLGGGFIIGAGVGTRYAAPCLDYSIKNGAHKRSFCNELDLPVFLRLGFGKERVYFNIDAGYSIGILSVFSSGWVPGGKKELCYNGLFVDPHIGFKMGRHSALALGIIMQNSMVSDHVTIETGTPDTPSSSIKTEVHSRRLFTPAINLRYVYVF